MRVYTQPVPLGARPQIQEGQPLGQNQLALTPACRGLGQGLEAPPGLSPPRSCFPGCPLRQFPAPLRAARLPTHTALSRGDPHIEAARGTPLLRHLPPTHENGGSDNRGPGSPLNRPRPPPAPRLSPPFPVVHSPRAARLIINKNVHRLPSPLA